MSVSGGSSWPRPRPRPRPSGAMAARGLCSSSSSSSSSSSGLRRRGRHHREQQQQQQQQVPRQEQQHQQGQPRGLDRGTFLSRPRFNGAKVRRVFLLPMILLAGFCSLQVCHGVRLLDDSSIPPHALKGQKAVLRCNYDLEGDHLYSVKWYYMQKEFYRYIPTDNPKVTIFNHHPGVIVNPYLSTEREVVLDNVDFSTSGQYRCEVSGDAPMFQTASTEGLLFVVALPANGPDIVGGHPRYNIGDRVNVTCASRRSLPAAQLTWYINGEKADRQLLYDYPEETDYDGLRTAKLGLNFKVRYKHFKNGDLKLKCTATISTVYWKSNEESVQGSGFNAHSAPVSESRGRTSAATSHITGLGLGSSSGTSVSAAAAAAAATTATTSVLFPAAAAAKQLHVLALPIVALMSIWAGQHRLLRQNI